MVTFAQLQRFPLFEGGCDDSQILVFWIADFIARRFGAAPSGNPRGQIVFDKPFVRIEELAKVGRRVVFAVAGPADGYADLGCQFLHVEGSAAGVTRLALTGRSALDAACRAVERSLRHTLNAVPNVRLEKIINSGQRGVEQEALRTATLFDLPTGGKTRQRLKWLQRCGLEPVRHFRGNLHAHMDRAADGTLLFGDRNAERRLPRINRPELTVSAAAPPDVAEVARWLERHDVRTLHVSGSPRHAAAAAEFLRRLFFFLRLPWSPPARGPDPRSADHPGYSLHSAGAGLSHRVWCVARWPDLRVWYCRGHAGGWVRDDQRDPLSGGTVSSAAASHHGGFWQSVPAEVREWVGQFHEGRLRVLRACASHGQPLCDLGRCGSSVLAYLIAHSGLPKVAGGKPLAGLPQREIAGRLGLPPTESVARLLRKVPPASCHPDLRRDLARLLGDGSNESTLEQLRHLERLNYGVLAILSERQLRRLAAPQLLREVALDRAEDVHRRQGSTSEVLQEICREALVRDAADRLRPLRSRRAAGELLEELRRVPQRAPQRQPQYAVGYYNPYGEPVAPLPGIPGRIEPLTERADLEAEGREMQHCVATYFSKVAAKASLIFRVFPCPEQGVERATLELVAGREGVGHRIAQLRGVRNRPVSVETTRFVEEWLAAGGAAGAGDAPRVPPRAA